jgi:beta-phosphoglucomutase-like phosphatase (HAD superfamily)
VHRDLLKTAPLEAVLFDIDGTMGISDPFHHEAWSQVLQKVISLSIIKTFYNCLKYSKYEKKLMLCSEYKNFWVFK